MTTFYTHTGHWMTSKSACSTNVHRTKCKHSPCIQSGPHFPISVILTWKDGIHFHPSVHFLNVVSWSIKVKRLIKETEKPKLNHNPTWPCCNCSDLCSLIWKKNLLSFSENIRSLWLHGCSVLRLGFAIANILQRLGNINYSLFVFPVGEFNKKLSKK